MLDVSGSMGGWPIDNARRVIGGLIDSMGPDDTFNLVTFAGRTDMLWSEPRPASAVNRDAARAFLSSRRGGGGTEMMRAIEAALLQEDRGETDRMRIVCFLTDGFVGNDMAIIDAVKRHADTTRVFSFGVGKSVNRYLLDGMARAGRGVVEYVTTESQAATAAGRFQRRLASPVLTDVEIDWGSLPITDVYPTRTPDLFGSTPILVHGRLNGLASGAITVRGTTVGGPWIKRVAIEPPGDRVDRSALASLWARSAVSDLMGRDLRATQYGDLANELKREIVSLGTEFRIVTQFTSFVAVEEVVTTVGGEPRTISVPVEMPADVKYEGIYGTGRATFAAKSKGARTMAIANRAVSSLAYAEFAPAPAGQAGPATSDATPIVSKTHKLDPLFLGLAERVEADGRHGHLRIGDLLVEQHRVDVVITLAETSEAVRRALGELGFSEAGRSSGGTVVFGSIDVRKLERLIGIEAVVFVGPLPLR